MVKEVRGQEICYGQDKTITNIRTVKLAKNANR